MTVGQPASPGPPTLGERLGSRAERRAWPRLGPVIGGAGAVLAFLGVITLSFDNLNPGDSGDDPDNLLGALLCALTVAAGYAVITRFRIGAAATAGSAVATAALPFVFFFLTFDESDAPPFAVDVTILVTTGLWLTAYLVGAARGRPLLLGAAATGLWLFILEQVEGVFTAPFAVFTEVQESFGGFGASVTRAPDPSTIGFLSLLFGAAYVAAGFIADRRALRGLATPLLVVGYLALVVGFAGVTEELEGAATGLLVAVTGAAVVLFATRAGRRGSAWLGGVAVAFGMLMIIAEVFEDTDSSTGPGIALILLGAAVAGVGEWWARAVAEPSELTLGPPTPPPPSEPPPASPTPPGSPWSSPPGPPPGGPPAGPPSEGEGRPSPWAPPQQPSGPRPGDPPR